MEGENHGEMETIGEVVYTFLGLGIRQVIPIIICFFHVGRESWGDGENNEKYVVYFPWISDRLGLTDNAERFDRSLFRNILIFRDRAL